MKISYNEKEERKQRICYLLRQRPNGLTEREIAEGLDLERRTLHNYLKELQSEGWLDSAIERGVANWFAVSELPFYLRPLQLTPEQAFILHLAARLLVNFYAVRNEVAETTLLKLASCIREDAGIDTLITESTTELAGKPESEHDPEIMVTVMRAYLNRKKCHITYHPLHRDAFQTTFSPYFFEPIPMNQVIYVNGYSSLPDKIRTYKLDRIESAKLTTESYFIPADYSSSEQRQNAWSIIAGENPIQVQLRFTPYVSRRVQETIWHPTQVLEPDGEHLIMTITVGSLIDIEPWVRSWGADVEVLKPERLRDSMIGHIRTLGQLYGLEQSEDDTAFLDDMFGG